MGYQLRKAVILVLSAISALFLIQYHVVFHPRVDANYLRARNRSVTFFSKYNLVLEPITNNFTPNGNRFFLVESSGRSILTRREICTIESVAAHHPEHSVYVLLTTDLLRRTSTAQHLLDIYPNIRFRFLEFETFIVNSPLRHLWDSGQIQQSWYMISHVSDIVRFLILYKFGGIYLDLDQLLVRPLPDVPNFIGKESRFVGVGVMRFRVKHPILGKFVDKLGTSFQGQEWNANGPALATSVLEDHCTSFEDNVCEDISIFPASAFYPIHWTNWKRYFAPEETDTVLEELTSDTFSIHLWGKQSSDQPLGGRNAYATLAEKHCPVTFSEVKHQFKMS
ncbi:hypothetical protein TCAL_02411 [Tigriopus californicus]|uniref:Alpha 1,4-glycosyltransferase domain-containing protein n=1 Tax=Tigriopus californicus TaxID=6832 RepID=A0A553NYB6_TIGCA|nr:lactosylceramide 4-alpha-galactosyltransferase-like [Tigriopus californicus]TRY70398.1 hypothetical protein TCAL_02411 [Tigriopus californicus]